jgi:hypothetical protein
MSDPSVIVALINKLPDDIIALAALLGAIFSYLNRGKITSVDGKVDGKMDKMTDDLRQMREALTTARIDGSYQQGVRDERGGRDSANRAERPL